MISQDKQYLAQLAKDYPHLAKFLNGLPARFNNATKQTKCEGPKCGKKLRLNQFHIFVTPAPEYKPLVLCFQCLKEHYAHHNKGHAYDSHVWITEN